MSLEKFIENFKTKSEKNRKELGNYLEGKTEKIGSNTIKYNFDDYFSKGVSYVGNLPYKLFFFSKDVGNYPREKTQNYIQNYVAESGLEDTTIRVGHNRIIEDTKKLFTDEKLKKIPLLSRILLGIPATIIGGLYSKLTRADYYNPFTKTAVIYSDVPAIATHELAHAKDYQDVGVPTVYSLLRRTYLGRLFQEARASMMAHNYIKSKDKNEKTSRYLIPAFLTYLFI